MQVYQVGEPFSPQRASWPEGSHLWMDEGIRLAMFLDRVSTLEWAAITNGVPRFAWIDEPRCGYLAFKFGDAPWSDCPFNPQRQTSAPFAVEEAEPGTHVMCHFFLVGASDGLIKFMKLITWPAAFVNAVRTSVLRLAAQPYHEMATLAAEDQHWAEFSLGPAMARLVPQRAIASCVGGTDRPAF